MCMYYNVLVETQKYRGSFRLQVRRGAASKCVSATGQNIHSRIYSFGEQLVNIKARVNP